MASGIPPVCAAEGGAAGFVKPGVTGLLAAARDGADFASQVELLLDYPDMRKTIGRAALNFARRQSWEKIFHRLFQSYAAVVANHRTRRAA
jgi:glycosyltransferase involved in cell wall biosynthesis